MAFIKSMALKMDEVKQQQEINKKIYADLLSAMNNVADLPQEKAVYNIEVIVKFMKKNWDWNKERGHILWVEVNLR